MSFLQAAEPIMFVNVKAPLFQSAIALALFSVALSAAGEPGANSGPTSQQVTKKWTNVLQGAQRDLESARDAATAKFVGGILASIISQSSEIPPATRSANLELLRGKTRDLIRSKSLKSAGILYVATWKLGNKQGPGSDGPVSKNSGTTDHVGKPGPDGLMLYFPFDHADSGGITRDESGTGNDGKVFGATWVPEGRKGGAYRFDITHLTDRIVVPNNPTLNPEAITLAAWIQAPDNGGCLWNRIFDKDYRKGYAVSISGTLDKICDGGRVGFEVNRMGGQSRSTVNDGRWHHVAATYDGTTRRLYIDGVEEMQKPAKQPGPILKSSWDLCIGNNVMTYEDTDAGVGEFQGFDGLIDEVRIYNRALNADEIRALCGSQSKVGQTSEAAQPTTPSGIQSTPADRIKQIKQLLEQGLIDKQEYDRRVKEILDAI